MRGELRRVRECDDRRFWKVKPTRGISRDISAERSSTSSTHQKYSTVGSPNIEIITGDGLLG
jgi:hypothetical protein